MTQSSRKLPSGRVTFAFTDVVGSTQTFIEHGAAYAAAVQELQATVAQHAQRHGGVVVSTEGDGTMLAFDSASGAVAALIELQVDIDSRAFAGLDLQLRAGAHTGNAEPVGDLYVALPVYIAARVSATGGAGQVVVSDEVIQALDDPVGVVVGEFRLKDVPQPMRLWRVAGDGTPLNAVPARRTNVAEPHTSFVGREEEVAELSRLLGSAPVVTVVGAGGLGKTRLVSEFALRQAEAFPAGVWLVELASLTSGEEVAPELASVLGLGKAVSHDAVRAELTRRGELVLVLDNCEHLMDAVADLVTELLPGCPPLRVLCTSREPLEVPGERVLRLSPLSTGVKDDGGLSAELFASRAATAGATIRVNDAPAVAEVCRLLDGVPLALELAAARVAAMPVDALAHALQEGDIALSRRGGDERQRSLESLLEWSLRLLSDAERDALFALAVFPGRFTLPMAEAVLAAAPGVSAAVTPDLARRSLLDLDGQEYRMLVTVGDAARRELRRRPELERAASEGLFDWALQRAAEPPIVIDQLITSDHLRAVEVAAQWGLDSGRAGRGKVVEHLVFWVIEGAASAVAMEIAQRILDQPMHETEDDVRLQCAAMRLLSGLGNTDVGERGVSRAAEVMAVAQGIGDTDLLAFAATKCAAVLASAHRFDEAEPLHLLSIDLSDEGGQRGGALLDLGVTLHLAGRVAEAEQWYRKALDQLRGTRHATTCLMDLGEALLDLHRYDEAAEQLQEALRISPGRRTFRACVLALLAEAEASRGERERARDIAEEADSELQDLTHTDPSLDYWLSRLRAVMASM